MTEHSKKSNRTVSCIIGLLLGALLLTTGCYTQLGTGYFEREPDYQEITEYETPYGDSVVVENYYHDYSYHRSSRYRRHFSTF